MDGRDERINLAGFTRLILDGRKATLFFPPESKRGPLVVYDLAIHGQLLLKDVRLCQGGPMVFDKSATPESCPEVVVPVEDQKGDWDACAVGYQQANWLSCKVVQRDYSERVAPEKQ